MVAQNELRDSVDRQHANDQALATELNRYQSQIEHFRKGFHLKWIKLNCKDFKIIADLYQTNHMDP